MRINRNMFSDKWKFDIEYYSYAREDIISLIDADKKDNIKILEIGCGCGAMLSKIQYL
jgi:tRNA G46 methylase TrmB